MSKSIERRTMESVVANIFLFGINILQNIVVVPILLRSWGVEKYGVWIALFALFTILQTLDIGHQNYVGNEFIKLYYKDKRKAQAVLGSSLLIAATIGLTLLLFSFAAASWGLVVLMAQWILSGSFGGILVRIILPMGLMARFAYISAISKIAYFVVLVVGAWYHMTILQVATLAALAQLLYSWGTFGYIRAAMPDFFPWWRGADWRLGFQNLRASLVITLNGFLDQLGNSGMILLITSYLSSMAVSSFATMRTVANTALIGTNTLVQSLHPDFIRLHALHDGKKLREVFYANWLLSGLLVNLFFVFLPLFARDAYIWWTGKQIIYDQPLLLLLLWSVAVINFFKGFSFYLLAINDLKINFQLSVIRIAILLLITLGGLSFGGLLAPALGFCVAELTVGIMAYVRTQHHLRAADAPIPSQVFLLASLPMLILTVYFALISLPNMPMWAVAALAAVLMTVSYGLFFSGHGAQLKARILGLLRRKRADETLLDT
jgi:O-antigen/teichoic acid export membrane protein